MGPPPTFNITCYGFHVWAEDFLAAGKMYAPTARKGSFVLRIEYSVIGRGATRRHSSVVLYLTSK
jgi:hypothetical protein